jgi:transposase
MDLDTGAIIFVGSGKSAESLFPFWKRLGRRRRQIKAVAMDMSAAYISAVRKRRKREEEKGTEANLLASEDI